MIKAIIFDLDGLLIDSETISYHIYHEVLKEYNINLSKELYVLNYCGKTDTSSISHIAKKYNIPLTVKEGLRLVKEKEYEFFTKGIILKKGAKELLDYLRTSNIKTALATSSDEKRAKRILATANITDMFDVFVFGDEIKNSKPAPDIFLKAAEKLKENVNDCIVLEDSEAGVEAAYNAHIPVINIPDLRPLSQKHLKMTFKQYKDLTYVINLLKKEK